MSKLLRKQIADYLAITLENQKNVFSCRIEELQFPSKSKKKISFIEENCEIVSDIEKCGYRQIVYMFKTQESLDVEIANNIKAICNSYLFEVIYKANPYFLNEPSK